MKIQTVSRGLGEVSIVNIKKLHIHFRLPHLDVLPDCVCLDVPHTKPLVPTPQRGSSVFTEVSAVLAGLFVSMNQNDLLNVGCNGIWDQSQHGKNDKYSVHFCFVPRQLRDLHKAMLHNTEIAQKAFDELATTPWNILMFANKFGNFDITCHRPRERSIGSILSIREGRLGLH